MRTRAGILGSAVLLAACGGGGGHDWEGYTAWLNGEVRDTPATVDEIRDMFEGEFGCDDDSLGYLLAIATDDDGDPENSLALIYFMCGEDKPALAARDVLGADAAPFP